MLPLLLSLPDTAMLLPPLLLLLPLLLLKHPSTTSPSTTTTTTTPLPAVQSKVTCSNCSMYVSVQKGLILSNRGSLVSYADPLTSDLGGIQRNSLFVLDM